MAEQDQRSMSIVPYSSNRDIVLRHNDAIVVYDHASRQLELHNNTNQENNIEPTECPYCHRPMRDTSPDAGRDSRHGSGTAGTPGFVNPGYFRMLGQSAPGTPEPSVRPSPRRPRLVQEVTPESGTGTPDSESGGAPISPGISTDAFSPGYFKRFFIEERELGRGGKGVVLLVKHVLSGVSLGHYACKRVPVGDDRQWLKKVLIEVQALQDLSHPNLVSYRHAWLEDVKLNNFGPSVPCAYILQQYCNAGDLHRYICGAAPVQTTPQQMKDRLRRRSKGQPEPPSNLPASRKLSFDEIYSFFKDIASGLQFLHLNNFIHRDLKPSNCLLHRTGHELKVLVSDFGEVQSENAMRTSTGSTGTVSYCAPEVLRRVSPSGPFGNFTSKSDVFSLGMILYFLCFAQLPYRNADVIDEDREDLDQLRAEISQWTGFNDVRRLRPELPDQLYTFLNRLLSVDPDKRPTADEVLNGIQTGAGINENRRSHRNGASSSNNRSGPRIVTMDSGNTGLSSALPPVPLSPSKSKAVMTVNPALSGALQKRKSYGTIEATDTSSTPEQDLALGPALTNNRDSPTPREQASYTRSSPLLLPPPNAHPTRTILRHRFTGTAVKFALLILKIVSMIQPCAPLLVVPWFFYPLLVLALIDFAFTSRVLVHGATLIVHVLVVGIAVTFGGFCASV